MLMRTIALGALLGLAGCTIASEEDQLENAIRDGLSNQGTVQEVNLTRQDENNIIGYAMLREASGRTGRLACTAQRSEGSNFNWRCSPAIDETVVQEIETAIRTNLSAQADVVSVDMARAGDDNNMTGTATLRDGEGNEMQVPCSARRTQGANFDWRCGEDAAPADAAGADGTQ